MSVCCVVSLNLCLCLDMHFSPLQKVPQAWLRGGDANFGEGSGKGRGLVLLNGSENRTISSTQITPSCHWTSSQAVTPGLELCGHVIGSKVTSGVARLCLWSERGRLSRKEVAVGERERRKESWGEQAQWLFFSWVRAWMGSRQTERSMRWIHGKVRKAGDLFYWAILLIQHDCVGMEEESHVLWSWECVGFFIVLGCFSFFILFSLTIFLLLWSIGLLLIHQQLHILLVSSEGSCSLFCLLMIYDC